MLVRHITFFYRSLLIAAFSRHFSRIEEKNDDFYKQFNLVVCGLDSIVARRWINSKYVSLVKIDEDGNPDPETIIPIIDGGTEAFKGHVRVILPHISPCFECTLDIFPPQVNVNLCTIANTPRTPEHCIAYAKLILWDQDKPFGITEGRPTPIDTDSTEHMQWLFTKAKERADNFHIEGVTFKLTQGVVKRIIPAIASTNALTAAACTNEAFKISTWCSEALNNYMFFNGVTGVYTYTYESEKKEECHVCGLKSVVLKVPGDLLLQDFIRTHLTEDPRFQMNSPSLRSAGKSIYMKIPASLEAVTRPNLEKKLRDLIENGALISVTDPALHLPVMFEITFTD
eukprot:TRINITY_DN1621_c0_g1_i2.p1 TRINITY_DN1621_c0_g1~~TRINITY_DN1621_c0_g1_i2.p1  ORF type:complete len:342 (+),score=34.96 TRINITY_DN1621_c0_g1_i2:384-1409(+)